MAWIETFSADEKEKYDDWVEEMYYEHYKPCNFPNWVDNENFRKAFARHVEACIDVFVVEDGSDRIKVNFGQSMQTNFSTFLQFEGRSEYVLPKWLLTHIDNIYPDLRDRRQKRNALLTEVREKKREKIREKLRMIGLECTEENIHMLTEMFNYQDYKKVVGI